MGLNVSAGFVMSFVFIAVVVTLFQGLLYGSELDETDNVDFDQPTGILDIIATIFASIWAFIVTLFNFFTFNVPGAPWYVRVLVSGMYVAAFSLTIVAILRG